MSLSRFLASYLALGFSLIFFGLSSVPSFSQAVLLYDGFDEIASNRRSVQEVVEVNRSPLFDNAQFLSLREGDKLVRAKEVQPPYATPYADPDAARYYLCSGGQYYLLWTKEENGKLLLAPTDFTGNSCLIFDWKLTMGNAEVMSDLLSSIFWRTVTIEQYQSICGAIRQNFPGKKISPVFDGELKKERLISIPGHTIAEFQGIAFEGFEDRLYKYTMKIGPDTCTVTGEILVQGPRYVRGEEFEGIHNTGPAYPNAAPDFSVDPATAKRVKAEYDEMIKFQKLITGVTDSKAQLK